MGQVAACGVKEEDESIPLPLLVPGSLCDFIWTQSRRISRVTTTKLQAPEPGAAFRGCSAGRVMANTHQQMPWHFQVQPPFWEQPKFTVLA